MLFAELAYKSRYVVMKRCTRNYQEKLESSCTVKIGTHSLVACPLKSRVFCRFPGGGSTSPRSGRCLAIGRARWLLSAIGAAAVDWLTWVSTR